MENIFSAVDHGLKAGGQGGVSDTKIVHEFVVARAHEGVVGERSAFGIDHFVAVTFVRPIQGCGG